MSENRQTKDIKFGLQKECELFDAIKQLDTNLIKTKSRYAPFDFESTDTLVELKSRNCKKDKYPTTMIGYNKVKKALESNKQVYFCFSFTDGLFYYKVNKNDSFLHQPEIGGRTDRGRQELNEYIFIDVNHLTKMCI